LLVGLFDDLLPLARVDRVTKSGLQITEGDFPTSAVDVGEQSAEHICEMKTDLSRQQRNYFRGKREPKPLETMPDIFPTRAHHFILFEADDGRKCERHIYAVILNVAKGSHKS
jgi:hypothetical protein